MDSNIKENFDVEIKFLIIDNLSKKVVKSYRRIHPNTADNPRKINWRGIIAQAIGFTVL